MADNHALADREQGQFPLSIATSLALESACNIHPELTHTNMPLLEFNEFWVNLRTLFRNMIGSMTKEAAAGVTPQALAHAIFEELKHIESIVKEKNSIIKPVFYVSNYAGMQGKYPRAQLRVDNTPRQKEYTAIQKQTIQLLLDVLAKAGGHDVRVFDLKLMSPVQAKALILTHYAYDLLSYYSFHELVLLESHTGAIKSRAQFYTKYHDGKALPMIPFREDLIQLFGDKESFHPYELKARRAIMDLAVANRWTSVTSGSKIKFDLDKLQNPYLRDIVKTMMV